MRRRKEVAGAGFLWFQRGCSAVISEPRNDDAAAEEGCFLSLQANRIRRELLQSMNSRKYSVQSRKCEPRTVL